MKARELLRSGSETMLEKQYGSPIQIRLVVLLCVDSAAVVWPGTSIKISIFLRSPWSGTFARCAYT